MTSGNEDFQEDFSALDGTETTAMDEPSDMGISSIIIRRRNTGGSIIKDGYKALKSREETNKDEQSRWD